ncbi:MAG: inorganic diphosphatase [Oscillospiraceae bacterium]|nr:inorganic diphosphatase [Oscillospiraceae bacterium]
MRKKLNVIIDRPIGYEHPDWPGFIYLVNYGYVPGVMAPDGEEQDVFVLGVDTPLQTFKGELIAIIHRRDDIEDKWVAVPEGMSFTAQEIEDAVAFSEQYFDSYIEMV